jgi:Mg-chelatase subunit ChlD
MERAMTAAEFRVLTDLVGKVLRRNFPALTFAIVITDGELVNMASNAQTNDDVVELLDAAAEQIERQGVPPRDPRLGPS